MAYTLQGTVQGDVVTVDYQHTEPTGVSNVVTVDDDSGRTFEIQTAYRNASQADEATGQVAGRYSLTIAIESVTGYNPTEVTLEAWLKKATENVFVKQSTLTNELEAGDQVRAKIVVPSMPLDDVAEGEEAEAVPFTITLADGVWEELPLV